MHPHDLPPELERWSEESEKSVLGSLLLDNEAWDRVGDLLLAEHFYSHAHRLVFTCLSALLTANKPADVITVYEDLERAGTAEEAGGLPYLNALAQQVPSAANIRRYAEIVAERALIRRMADSADKAREIALSTGEGTVASRLNEVVQLFQGLQITRGRSMPRHISETAAQMVDRIDDLVSGRRSPGIATRIPGLDRLLTGGLKPGKQIVLAARPSIGKTSLALAILLNVAMQGHPAAFLSQEMEASELMDRAAANLGQIDLEHILTGKLDAQEWSDLSRVLEDVRTLPIYIDDQAALTLSDIQAKARMLVRQHGIKLLVVDYLQLCAGNPKADKRHHQIEEISRGTKTLAKQLGITIVLLSQLGRDVERRTSGKPVLSDLKESGSIEEDADVAGLLSMAYERSSGTRVIELELAKNRQGRKGSVMLAFEGQYQRWTETITEDKPLRPAAKHYTEDV